MATVLIVDDNPDQVFLTRHLLEREGFVCNAADDAQVAWKMLASQIPDVVVLDLHLGVEDGWSLLERLRADPRLSAMPVVVMTAAREEAIATRALSLGAEYLDKSEVASLLVDRVQSAIASAERLRPPHR